ncbi:MAG: hypothetical protein NVS3B26_14030 [Mycobacteriales bacterium]
MTALRLSLPRRVPRSASLALLALALAGCGGTSAPTASSTAAPGAGSAAVPPATPTDAAPASPTSSPTTVSYLLHMDFFSRESKISPVRDPQVFVAAPGAPAATGLQMIKHVAGVKPAPKDGPAATALLAADGTPLKITLGQWEKAAGGASVACIGGQERLASHLTGLIPSGSYSTFVVHLDVQGKGRFTPWGDAQGTTNNFTADTSGSAAPVNTLPTCLTEHVAAVIIWHSDGQPHGPNAGVLGVTWHNSLITPLP